MRGSQMRAAFKSAGVLPRNVEFQKAIALFWNNGGTVAEGRAIYEEAAKRMQGRDQNGGALDGPMSPVQPLHDARDHSADVSNDQGPIVSPSPAGSDVVVRKHTRASPGRGPSSRQRESAARVRNVIALTVLDTYKIRDGRPIGKVRFGEVERLRAANVMEASIFRQIQNHAPSADPNAMIGDIIKPADFQRMQQRAAEVADAI